eukprot:1896168-Amphidinium_carterae.1
MRMVSAAGDQAAYWTVTMREYLDELSDKVPSGSAQKRLDDEELQRVALDRVSKRVAVEVEGAVHLMQDRDRITSKPFQKSETADSRKVYPFDLKSSLDVTFLAINLYPYGGHVGFSELSHSDISMRACRLHAVRQMQRGLIGCSDDCSGFNESHSSADMALILRTFISEMRTYLREVVWNDMHDMAEKYIKLMTRKTAETEAGVYERLAATLFSGDPLTQFFNTWSGSLIV